MWIRAFIWLASARALAPESFATLSEACSARDASARAALDPVAITAALRDADGNVDDLDARLGGPPARRWRAVFSAKPDATGRFLPINSVQQFDGEAKTYENAVTIGPLTARFCARFELNGRATLLQFESLCVGPAVLNFGEGSFIRSVLERGVRGGAKGEGEFRKRPNIFTWRYVDDELCVGMGSSGAIALWARDDG